MQGRHGEASYRDFRNGRMDTIRELDVLARFLATQDAQTLAQALLDLAEDHAPVAAFLERMPLRATRRR